MSRNYTGVALLGGVLALASCTSIPDFRSGGRLQNPFEGWSLTHRQAPADTPMGPPTPDASTTESACMAAGRDAGFDVRGVVGTRAVTGEGGIDVGRDVMLRVRRDGREVDIRCSYSYADGTARIMTL